TVGRVFESRRGRQSSSGSLPAAAVSPAAMPPTTMPPTATPVTATRAPVRVKAGSVVRIWTAIIRYDRRNAGKCESCKNAKQRFHRIASIHSFELKNARQGEWLLNIPRAKSHDLSAAFAQIICILV